MYRVLFLSLSLSLSRNEKLDSFHATKMRERSTIIKAAFLRIAAPATMTTTAAAAAAAMTDKDGCETGRRSRSAAAASHIPQERNYKRNAVIVCCQMYENVSEGTFLNDYVAERKR
jgi:hypothetical protein